MSIVERPVMPEELARLKRQREEADARYNEALTALDQAIAALQPPALPALPSPPDEAQITPLNERWAITANAPALPEGWRGRAAAFVMSLVRPYLERQEAFNATLVDHVNRSVLPARAQVEAARASLVALQAQHQHVERLQSKLILLLQQVTPFVDSKDYEFYAISQQIADSVQGLAAALSDVSDDMLKRWERYESLRASVSTLQVAVQALRRELQQRGPVSQATIGATPTGASVPTGTPSPVGATPLSPATTASVHLSSDPLAAHTYVAFENVFRGDPQVIAERQQSYVDLFRGRQDVLDIGCGRGEFLKLLHGHGTWARGIDLNHEMVALCRADGLDVTEADALTYLRQCRDGELGGLIALQVVEHLPPDYLLELVDEAHRVLSPGSPILLETINVASWSAFFSSYLRDITHMRPLHPDTLRFLVDAAGFADTEVQDRKSVV